MNRNPIARCFCLIGFSFFIFIVSPAFRVYAEESYDPIRETIFLLQNQDIGKAKAKIAKSEQDLDKSEVAFLNGMVAFYEKRYPQAEQELLLAWKDQFRSHQIELYLCQSGLEQKKAITLSCETYFPDQAEWSAYHYNLAYRSAKAGFFQEKAWNYLQSGLTRFPSDHLLIAEKIKFLFENNLYTEAESFLKFLPNRTMILEEDDCVQIANLFRQKNLWQTAAWLLEEVHIKNPESKKIALELAQTYVQAQKFVSAAEILQNFARQEHKYFLETAELFRRGKAYSRALFINQFVPEEKEKIKQRFITLMDLSDYGAAANMRSELLRLGLVDNSEDIAYGLAFALFQESNFSSAEKLMEHIQRPDLVKKVAWMRQSIETCRDKNWECIL